MKCERCPRQIDYAYRRLEGPLCTVCLIGVQLDQIGVERDERLPKKLRRRR